MKAHCVMRYDVVFVEPFFVDVENDFLKVVFSVCRSVLIRGCIYVFISAVHGCIFSLGYSTDKIILGVFTYHKYLMCFYY